MKSVLFTEMLISKQLESQYRINHVNAKNGHRGYAKFVEDISAIDRAGDAVHIMKSIAREKNYAEKMLGIENISYLSWPSTSVLVLYS